MLEYAIRTTNLGWEEEAEGRSSAVRFLSPLSSSSAVHPRRDAREDTFNLSGFFPSAPGSPSSERYWLDDEQREPDEDAQVDDEVQATASGTRPIMPQRSLSMTALDDYAKDVISKEGNVGILSLVRIPSFLNTLLDEPISEEDEYEIRTPSSLSIDEPFDSESLHASLTLRRTSSAIFPAPPKKASSLSLFTDSPVLIAAEKAEEGSRLGFGWASAAALCSSLLGPVL